MKIYTKTGDKGETGLYGGKRISKDSLRIEAIGTVDELNSAIGVVIAQTQKSKLRNQNHNAKLKTELEKIQNDLFTIGAEIALSSSTPRNDTGTLPAGRQVDRARTIQARVKEFEDEIDAMTKELPELRNFILPGGGEVGTQLHLARSICRRAERRIVALSKEENVENNILIYFNRLSDLFFTLARFANYTEKKKETIWKQNG